MKMKTLNQLRKEMKITVDIVSDEVFSYMFAISEGRGTEDAEAKYVVGVLTGTFSTNGMIPEVNHFGGLVKRVNKLSGEWKVTEQALGNGYSIYRL